MILVELISRILLLEKIGFFINFLVQKLKNRSLTFKDFRKRNKNENFEYQNRIVGAVFLISIVLVFKILEKNQIIW